MKRKYLYIIIALSFFLISGCAEKKIEPAKKIENPAKSFKKFPVLEYHLIGEK